MHGKSVGGTYLSLPLRKPYSGTHIPFYLTTPSSWSGPSMKIFVTGVAGFIGSRLSRALLDRGDQVVGIDNMSDYYALEHKERHLRDLTEMPGFQFVRGDLRDAELVFDLFRRHEPDAVAHLGGMAAVRYSV